MPTSGHAQPIPPRWSSRSCKAWGVKNWFRGASNDIAYACVPFALSMTPAVPNVDSTVNLEVGPGTCSIALSGYLQAELASNNDEKIVDARCEGKIRLFYWPYFWNEGTDVYSYLD
jgi:hypothetical protein